MKIQDIVFFVVLTFLLYRRSARLFVIVGIAGIILSMPLFQLKVALFTAQRLVQYAAVFFLVSTVMQLREIKKSRN